MGGILSHTEIANFRKESGLTQSALAAMLNDVLDMKYTAKAVSSWENGANIPDYVEEAIYGLMAGAPPREKPVSGDGYGEPEPAPSYDRPVDAMPGLPFGADVVGPRLPVGASMEAVCVEMFRGMGGMIELAGGFFGGPKVVQDQATGKLYNLIEVDGKIISRDAETLGAAWAKLASQNAWVNRIVMSLTTGGAWVEVIAASSGTMLAIYQNHAQYQVVKNESGRNESSADPVPEPATL